MQLQYKITLHSGVFQYDVWRHAINKAGIANESNYLEWLIFFVLSIKHSSTAGQLFQDVRDHRGSYDVLFVKRIVVQKTVILGIIAWSDLN